MPGGDGTGPFGTFRNCMPVGQQPSQNTPFYGRRFFGRGGFGRGFRWRYLATGQPGWTTQGQTPQQPEISKQEEIEAIKQEIEALKRRLEELKE